MAPKVRPWKCNFPDCTRSFRTEEKLKEHKKYNEDHEYCEYCDTNFDDYDKLVDHKVEQSKSEIKAIRKWEVRETVREHRESLQVGLNLNGERRSDPKPQLLHLCCKHCGQNFESIGGRDLHMQRVHPLKQELHCACGKFFTKASHMMHHFENGLCKIVSAKQFHSLIQHKQMLQDLLNDPQAMIEMANANYYDTVNEDEGGGVKLDLLQNNPLGGQLQDALKPTAVSDFGVPEDFPELPSKVGPQTKDRQHELEMEMADLKLVSGGEGKTLRNPLAKPLKLEVNGPPSAPPRRAGTHRSMAGSVAGTSDADTSEPGGAALATSTDFNAWSQGGPSTTNAWRSTANVLQALFPDAKAKVAPTQAATSTVPLPDNTTNLLYSQRWNPGSYEYDPEVFYNPVIEMYRCPFTNCGKLTKRPAEITAHIEWAHRASRIRCPTCLRLFDTFTALVAHCESATAKCKISQTDQFGQAIDGFSGGFLSARLEERPDMDRLADGSAPVHVNFTATTPMGLSQESDKVYIGHRPF